VELMSTHDTIAAIASAAGRGGIAVIRVSGATVLSIATALCGEVPPTRTAVRRTFRDSDGNAIDTGLVLYFPAPASFTGEHVLELHGHGGSIAPDLLLARVLSLGARLARPGEFSERAFLNGKMDLAQAEALADLIDAGSAQAARAALRSLQGEFSHQMHALTQSLIETRMYIEAAIDFPEEEVDFLRDSELQMRMQTLKHALHTSVARAQQGSLLRDGMTVLIAGRPNAGKSSLLNLLAARDTAIVTDIPGTTRDLLHEHVQIDGMPLHLIDTAGLRSSPDAIEAEGIRRARIEMQRADRILYLIDAVRRPTQAEIESEIAELPQGVPLTIVFNKIDLIDGNPTLEQIMPPRLHLSVAQGLGIDLLKTHLKACVGFAGDHTSTFSARRRHLDALERAATHVGNAESHLDERRAGELTAEELRLAQHCIGEITGEFTSDDLLGRIFSTFCIGK
jgi:tRNA modification GTPase